MIKVETNPKLDIVLDRTIDVPRELVWKAWTDPKHVLPWFTPSPWKTTACDIDLRVGGGFHVTMQGPEGEKQDVVACYLEIVENERLSWTDTLAPGFRPKTPTNLAFTAVITLEKKGNGTRYLVQALHADPEMKAKHESMGFLDGWGAALDQLVAYCKTL